MDDTSSLEKRYVTDVLQFWREYLRDFVDYNDEKDRPDQDLIRNNTNQGLLVQSKKGTKVALTPEGKMQILSGSYSITCDETGVTLPSIPFSVQFGILAFGSLGISRGGILESDQSFKIDRTQICVGNLTEHSRKQYPVPTSPSKERKIQLLNTDIHMEHLLDSPEKIENKAREVAYHRNEKRYYERVAINGYLFVASKDESPTSAYKDFYHGLCKAGELNPETVSEWNAFIHDGRYDFTLMSNNDKANLETSFYWKTTKYVKKNEAIATPDVSGLNEQDILQPDAHYVKFQTTDKHEIYVTLCDINRQPLLNTPHIVERFHRETGDFEALAKALPRHPQTHYESDIIIDIDPRTCEVFIQGNDRIEEDLPVTLTHEGNHAYQDLVGAQHMVNLRTQKTKFLKNRVEADTIQGPVARLQSERGDKSRDHYLSGYTFRTRQDGTHLLLKGTESADFSIHYEDIPRNDSESGVVDKIINDPLSGGDSSIILLRRPDGRRFAYPSSHLLYTANDHSWSFIGAAIRIQEKSGAFIVSPQQENQVYECIDNELPPTLRLFQGSQTISGTVAMIPFSENPIYGDRSVIIYPSTTVPRETSGSKKPFDYKSREPQLAFHLSDVARIIPKFISYDQEKCERLLRDAIIDDDLEITVEHGILTHADVTSRHVSQEHLAQPPAREPSNSPDKSSSELSSPPRNSPGAEAAESPLAKTPSFAPTDHGRTRDESLAQVSSSQRTSQQPGPDLLHTISRAARSAQAPSKPGKGKERGD